MKQSKIIIISAAGLLTMLVLYIIISLTSKSDSSNGEAVNLAPEVKDITHADVEKQIKDNTVAKPYQNLPTEEDDPVNIERMQQLIVKSELPSEEQHESNNNENFIRPIMPTQHNIDSVARSLTQIPRKKKKKVQKKEMEQKPVELKRAGFNTVQLHKNSKRNAIKAYVHSDQTVMVGSTIKMRLGEDCFTDDGQYVKKDSPVFGEVKKIDGERVIVEISTVNLNGNILPFKKDVYSSDALEGIWVPGNAKSDINKDASSGAVDGANMSVTGGLDMGTQLLAGATNGVVNATKQAASKNIKKIKVLVKTNYQVFLMENKDNKDKNIIEEE